MKIDDAERYFSQSYREAREKFLNAAEAAGATVTTYPHPLTGPDGGPLACDTARIGTADAPNLAILGSGTHGVEGFCGSGIQTALLSAGIADELPADTALLFIHALNPWGFAWGRRVNEDNVDLNRNFRNHAAPAPDNPGYVALADALNPTRWDEGAADAAQDAMRAYAKKHGPASLQHAFSAGQTSHPAGVQFSGTEPVWSNTTFHAILRGALASARRLLFIDVHSGLGPKGHGEIIVTEPATSACYERARALWGERVLSTKGGGSVSSDVSGSITDVIAAEAGTRAYTAIGLEFGTVAMSDVTAAMIADNWLHAHGDPEGPAAAAIKKQIRDAFYCDDADWKNQVTATTVEILEAGLKGFAS